MKLIVPVALLLLVFSTSCRSVKDIFKNKTPHEKYAEKLEKRIDETPAGRQWLATAERAMQNAQLIATPYHQLGSFRVDRPQALALQFQGVFGQRIQFDLSPRTATQLVIFADLFRQGNKVSHILSADTTSNQFSVDIEETGSSFTGNSDQPKYPAICSGQYAINGAEINFTNGCAWTADFDGTLILNGKYSYTQKGDSLQIQRTYGGQVSDVYKLKRR